MPINFPNTVCKHNLILYPKQLCQMFLGMKQIEGNTFSGKLES